MARSPKIYDYSKFEIVKVNIKDIGIARAKKYIIIASFNSVIYTIKLTNACS